MRGRAAACTDADDAEDAEDETPPLQRHTVRTAASAVALLHHALHDEKRTRDRHSVRDLHFAEYGVMQTRCSLE